jgi:peptide/nickel transport system permease protein
VCLHRSGWALSVGVGQTEILFRQVLTDCLAALIAQATMGSAGAILSIAALGLLGLGAIPLEPGWGAMLGDNRLHPTSGACWAVIVPGLAIMLAVLGFDLPGYAIRWTPAPRVGIPGY